MSAEPRRAVACLLRLLAVGGLVWLPTCGGTPSAPSDILTFAFDFARGAEGWAPGFSDYSLLHPQPELMELVAEHRPLPPPLDVTRGGLFISGKNFTADLFMFWKRRVDGLRSDRSYGVQFTVEFATNVPKGIGGIGRADGDVSVKVGVSSAEPVVVPGPVGRCPSYLYCLTIDKGNQSQGGQDAVVIGTVGNLSGTETWELKVLRSEPGSLTITPDRGGALWLLVGTDSGFEGRTSLYYTRITAILTPR